VWDEMESVKLLQWWNPFLDEKQTKRAPWRKMTRFLVDGSQKKNTSALIFMWRGFRAEVFSFVNHTTHFSCAAWVCQLFLVFII
jgi:hypothetical protein